MPPGMGESQIEEVSRRLDELRTPYRVRLRVSPAELLRKVPFFRTLSHADFEEIEPLLQKHSVEENTDIITQGEPGDAVYLIARGVVRVLHIDKEKEEEHPVGTLLAGDFFGEQALLHDASRNATCRAVTPCYLYKLKREDFDQLRSRWPAIEKAVEEADQARKGA